jgi:benzodiazapine receptor
VNVAAGGRNRGTSDQYFTPITPSGWAFSVWGLIFFLQAIGVVWAAIPFGYGRDGGLKERVVTALALPWPLGWLFQCLWQFSFLARSKVGMWFGLLFLIGAFASMAWAALRLKTRFTPVPRSWHGALTHWAFWVPTSVNAAWLSAATIVGAVVVGVAHGAGVTPLRWVGIALVALVTALAAAVAGWKPDIAWPATLVWALAGVFAAHRGDVAVAIAAMVCLVVCVLATVGASVLVFRGRQAAAAARAGAPVSAPPAGGAAAV